MASRLKFTYKFRYDDDLGRTTIKRQRVYIDPNTDEQITPITSLFLARVIDTPEKVTGTSKGLRRLLTYIGDRTATANIPYRNPEAHIVEILAVERVICGDYYGERNITGGTANSFSGQS